MGFLRSIGRVFRRVTSGIKKAFKTVTKPFRKVVGGLMGAAKKILGKLPFGNVIKSFLGKFFKNPLALALLGPLGGFGALAMNAGNIGNLANLATSAAQTPAWGHPAGRANAAHILACAHARNAFLF